MEFLVDSGTLTGFFLIVSFAEDNYFTRVPLFVFHSYAMDTVSLAVNRIIKH
jgi:hypothetical protein